MLTLPCLLVTPPCRSASGLADIGVQARLDLHGTMVALKDSCQLRDLVFPDLNLLKL